MAAGFCAAQSLKASPKFEIADVHSIPLSPKAAVQTSSTGGFYEVRYATMSDFIRLAYGYEPDKITGGPNWLELDQFDLTVKMPPYTSQDDLKLMLQTLLAERFQLALHKEMKPLPTYVLAPTRKPLLKEASGSEAPECKIENAAPAPDGVVRQMAADGPNGAIVTFTLGPGDIIHYRCRNMSMAAFAAGLRGMWGVAAQVGPNNVIDQTGLSGAWNFDVHWTAGYSPAQGNSGPRVSLAEAVEKQLGLKLEQKSIPAPVLVVDSVNRKPSGNPPGTAEALPPTLPPKEFEVADVKPSDPNSRVRRFATPSLGRLTVEGMTLESLVYRAFGVYNSEEVVGIPGWAGSARFDVNATFQAASSFAMADGLAPMMRALLEDRFQMKWHKEERPITAYSLVAVKPNMKKADPNSRIFCKTGQPPPGSPNARTITCRNASMELFAAKLNAAPGLNWPIADATGLEGGWDFALEYRPDPPIAFVARGGNATPDAPAPIAADPNSSLTIFEAVQKLGLKLEARKRQLPVIVIDHLEQKPTEN